jgi:beta-mannosidase
MVDLLGHHPSIALWCAHNEPLAITVQPGAELGAGTLARLGASMFLPSWNKDVLDRSLARAIAKADPTRPVDRSSGIIPGPASGGTDCHLYFGWFKGEMGGLASALRAWPRQARFVTEFGAQAVPETDAFLDPERWPDLDWERLWHRHALQFRVFARYVPMADYESYADWKAATQQYQAALLQLQCEDLRRLKYRPNGGFLQFCFADAHDAVTWSVLDVERVPKPGFAALRDACRPVLPMVEPRRGLVHVANEQRAELRGAQVRVRGGERSWAFAGDLAADAVTYIGTVDLPADATEVEVVLEHPDLGSVRNAYGPVLLAGARRTAWVP